MRSNSASAILTSSAIAAVLLVEARIHSDANHAMAVPVDDRFYALPGTLTRMADEAIATCGHSNALIQSPRGNGPIMGVAMFDASRKAAPVARGCGLMQERERARSSRGRGSTSHQRATTDVADDERGRQRRTLPAPCDGRKPGQGRRPGAVLAMGYAAPIPVG